MATKNNGNQHFFAFCFNAFHNFLHNQLQCPVCFNLFVATNILMANNHNSNWQVIPNAGCMATSNRNSKVTKDHQKVMAHWERQVNCMIFICKSRYLSRIRCRTSQLPNRSTIHCGNWSGNKIRLMQENANGIALNCPGKCQN